jgi:hypothetical protein
MENNPINKVSDIKRSNDMRLVMLQNLGTTIKNLQQNINKTPMGLPESYIDPSIILEFVASNKDEPLTSQQISQATIDIDYIEGLPVINGLPFWERLDCEPLDYYNLFKLYRNQKEQSSDFTRSFENLISQANTNLTLGYIAAVAKIYHWRDRIKAYDQYRNLLVENEKENLTKIMNGRHQKTAEKMWTLCEQYLTDLADNKDKLLTFKPSEFKALLIEARKLERLSLGLPGDRPPQEKQSPTQNTEITNIKIENKTQVNTENKTQTINLPQDEKVKYLQEIIDVLHNANALPENLKAQDELQGEVETEVIDN